MKEIWLEIEEKQDNLNACLKSFQKNGESYAKAKQDYAISLRQEILKLRAEGYPVTIITDIAKGEPKVAENRLKKDIAESLVKANQEAINVNKIELNILKLIYEKEYQN